METRGLDVDSNCDSLVESVHPYSKYLRPPNGPGGVMYNLFKPGSSFNVILDSDSRSSSDPIRADCSLNDGVATAGLCSPKEDYFNQAPSKRTSIHIQIEDDEICGLNHFPNNNASLIDSGAFLQNSVQSYVPNIPVNFELKESYCGVSLLVDNNLPDDNGIHFINPLTHSDEHLDKDHSNLFYSNTNKLNLCAQEDYKPRESQRVSDNKPSLASFMTMENSNNAIDNNLQHNISVSQSAPSSVINCDSNNHVFKLPNTELTFNGTLKHLQKLQPIVDYKETKEEYKYTLPREYTHKEESSEYMQYKSSDELTSNSSPGASASSSKSGITIFSSASQFPSDCEIVSSDIPSKNMPHKFSDVLEVNKSCMAETKAFTFTGTVGPLKSRRNEMQDSSAQQQHLSHNKSGESMDSSYNSGAQSPNIFSDDEDDYNDQKSEQDKIDIILNQFEKCDKLLIESLERTLQGVLPPPSVTICQLTAVDIIERYKKYLPKFNNPQEARSTEILDPEASASMTPPRRISSDVSSDPHLSSTLAMALENTMQHTFEQSMSEQGNENETLCVGNAGSAAHSKGFLHLNGSEDIATNEDWPQILISRWHGVHYNSTPHSEHIDLLLSRYSSRFIGCETASSCVTLQPTASSSRVPRRSGGPRGLGAPSPGRRLSHLAKRRAAFCTAASLPQPTNRRQILIDRKKFGNNPASRSQLNKGKSPRMRRTPGKKTPGRKTPGKKTPGKKTPGKKTPSSAQKKLAAKRLGITTEVKLKSQPTRETSKRALFLSPENVTKPETFNSAPRPSTSRVIRSKRALFGSPVKGESDNLNVTRSDSKAAVSFNRIGGFSVDNMGRKRCRLDDSFSQDLEATPKLQKSLTFGGDKIGTSCSERVGTLTRRATEYVTSNGELTDINKKKLLWAVAEALRSHGIGMSHESFKQFATALVRLTRKLCTLPIHLRALKTPFSSTSDTLLKIARLHVFSVIKGRTVDELFAEEQNKQLNAAPTKVTGYVPPNFDPSKHHMASNAGKNSENSYGEVKPFKPDPVSINKKTVLQDKTVNIDTKSTSKGSASVGPIPDLKKPSLYRDNNKLRARRQISFDNMEDPSSR